MLTIDLTDVIDAANVSVTHLARHSHFAMKASERGSVAQVRLGQKLQRNWLTQLQVVSAIDLTHAPLSE
jgi:hypothetical protein